MNNVTFCAFLLTGWFIKRLDFLSFFLLQNTSIPTDRFLFKINLNAVNILMSCYVPLDRGSARYKSATYTRQHKLAKKRRKSICRGEFEPTIEREKMFRALDRAAAVVGYIQETHCAEVI
jgi:hypothetical protein